MNYNFLIAWEIANFDECTEQDRRYVLLSFFGKETMLKLRMEGEDPPCYSVLGCKYCKYNNLCLNKERSVSVL